MSIAIRRHHRARLQKARKNYWRREQMTPKQLGMVVNTPATCSCWMCGNWRRIMKEKTIQERRNEQLIEGWDL